MKMKNKKEFAMDLPCSEDLVHSERDCICDRCINEYITLYERIENLNNIIWTKKLSKEKRDVLNEKIHKKISLKERKKLR